MRARDHGNVGTQEARDALAQPSQFVGRNLVGSTDQHGVGAFQRPERFTQETTRQEMAKPEGTSRVDDDPIQVTSEAAMLKPSGQLFLVANRHLPYEAALTESFRKHSELPGSPAFKLFLAEGPQRTTQRSADPARRPRVSHNKGRRA